MSDRFPEPPGGVHLRTVAMPRDATASGDIFRGRILSQMDPAGGTFAVSHSGERVGTVRIEAVELLEPVTADENVRPTSRGAGR